VGHDPEVIGHDPGIAGHDPEGVDNNLEVAGSLPQH
jgi:hypothetical protein